MAENSKIQWTEIPDHSGYWACSDGTIWNQWRKRGQGRGVGPLHYRSEEKRQLKTPPDKRGYPVVNLGRGKKFILGRLILFAFIGPCPEGMECRHIDGDTLNSQLSNLAWGTPKENHDDQRRHGTRVAGDRHHWSKISSSDVVRIRKMYRTGQHFQRELAERFGTSQSVISSIVTRKHRVTAREES